MSQNHFYRKAHGELQFIIFLALFVVMLNIVGQLLNQSVVEKTAQSDNGLLNSISSLLEGIPVVGTFWSFIMTGIQLAFLNTHLALIYGALIGIPLGYLVIRLARGGG